MAPNNTADLDKCLTLLHAAIGDFDAKKPLAKILKRVPEFGTFEWMLTILGLEIDLRVDIPESLADDLDQRADEFARKVAALPKVDSPGYTLECLGLVAQALLSLEPDVEAPPAKVQKATGNKAKRNAKTSDKPAAAPRRVAKRAAHVSKVPSRRAARGAAQAKTSKKPVKRARASKS